MKKISAAAAILMCFCALLTGCSARQNNAIESSPMPGTVTVSPNVTTSPTSVPTAVPQNTVSPMPTTSVQTDKDREDENESVLDKAEDDLENAEDRLTGGDGIVG